MTIKEFAEKAGMEYQDALNVIADSTIHQKGKNIDYDFQDLRKVILKFLKRQESRTLKKLEAVQRSMKLIYGMRE